MCCPPMRSAAFPGTATCWCGTRSRKHGWQLLTPRSTEVVAGDPPPEGTAGHHFYFLTPTRLPAADRALRLSGAPDVAEGLVTARSRSRLRPHPDRPQHPALQPPAGRTPSRRSPAESGPPRLVHHARRHLSLRRISPDSGNVWVWPGSHLVHQQLFAGRGPRALLGRQRSHVERRRSTRRWRNRIQSSHAGEICCSRISCSVTTSGATRPRIRDASSTTGSAPLVTKPLAGDVSGRLLRIRASAPWKPRVTRRDCLVSEGSRSGSNGNSAPARAGWRRGCRFICCLVR